MSIDENKIRFTREWLVAANNDLLAVSRLLQDPPLTALAAFHCQQAVEKALKGYLMWHDTPFRKTHNLLELVEQCSTHDGSFIELKEIAESLTPYATEARYPDTELDMSREALADSQRMVTSALAFVRGRLPDVVTTPMTSG
ncbi:MAG: HEPN domain-containing protein [Sphaerobacteraceae bacterium]|nr:MAG: HEPN domain-containing protein [Sphaerobacteraceae bacterium]